MPKSKSLKKGLLLHVIIPVVFFVVIDAAVSYLLTIENVDHVLDRKLLDSANYLVRNISLRDEKVLINLPLTAIQKWLPHSDSELIFYKITTATAQILAGDATIPDPPANITDAIHPVYYDGAMYGEPVRVLSMRITFADSAEIIHLQIAETLHERQELVRDVVVPDMIPQIGLILLTSLFLFTGLKRSLKPLRLLTDQIANRKANDLRPIPDEVAFPEVQMLTDTINQLLNANQLAISTQQRFITNAAHQLRTPLAGLKLQAERALRETEVIGMQPALHHIQNSVDRMTHLTKQLLVLANSERITGNWQLSPLNLCELAKQTCMDWVPKALQRNIELSFESSREEVFIQGDSIMLRELLANLLDNAIAYGNENGKILVRVNYSPSPTLSIEDNGPGIPITEIDKVFERFYRISGSTGNGCGLGLAIVKEIADLHQARLELKPSLRYGGCKFDLVFAE